MNHPTPIQPVVVNPEDFSFSYNHNFMKENEMYEFTYDDTKMAVKKTKKDIQLFSE